MYVTFDGNGDKTMKCTISAIYVIYV